MNFNRPNESGNMSGSWAVGGSSHGQTMGGGGGVYGGGASFGGGGTSMGGGGPSHHSFSTTNVTFNATHAHGQSQVEPMHHSPIGGSHLGGGDRVTYLPSYLMGDGPGAKSPKTKLRKDTPTLDLSNLGHGGGMASPHSSGSPPKTSPHSLFPSPLNPRNPPSTPTSSRPKATGPPKHGLGTSSSTALSPTSPVPSKSARLEVSGEGQGSWVTVFGFQPASQSFVLQTFSQVGSIIEYKSVQGCNFMHIRYSNTVEARKALWKNGGILGGNTMIGVIKFEPSAPPPVLVAPPTDPAAPPLQSKIRPLANDNLSNQQIPVRESGLMSKVTELLGW